MRLGKSKITLGVRRKSAAPSAVCGRSKDSVFLIAIIGTAEGAALFRPTQYGNLL
jgi:hypothetical protein